MDNLSPGQIKTLASLFNQRRYTEGEALARRLTSRFPQVGYAWKMLGVMLKLQGRGAEALEPMQKAAERLPRDAEAHNNLGVTLHEQGRLRDAEASYRRALEIQPDYAEVHYNLGVTLHGQGRLGDAEAGYRRALAIKPGFAEAHSNLGVTLKERGRLREAEAGYRRALEIQPDFAEAHNNLGVTLKEQGRLREAEAGYRRALEIQPDYAEAHNNLGNVLRELGRLTESEAGHRRALEIKPDYAEAYNNLGNTLRELGRFTESEAGYRRAFEINPDYADAKYNRSLLLLLLGRFEEGWEQYEWRWKRKEYPEMPDFGRPLWLGETSIQGKHVRLWGDHGIGDSIQFLRYVPRVADLAAEVFVQLPSTLAELVQRSFKSVTVVAERGGPVEFDYHCPLMSLALAFRTFSEADIPGDVPYLTPDPEKRSKWRKRLEKDDKPLVGIAWRGNPRHKNDHNRSIPFEWLRGVVEIDRIRWVVLQKPLENREALQLRQLAHCNVASDELTDFDETAAVIAELDLVISADTAVAHLAGALGKPVWVLLPYDPDWRWLLDREESPWYPSARLFRQPKIGDWNSVFQRVAQELCSEFPA